MAQQSRFRMGKENDPQAKNKGQHFYSECLSPAFAHQDNKANQRHRRRTIAGTQ
jgi:hypothetical protein